MQRIETVLIGFVIIVALLTSCRGGFSNQVNAKPRALGKMNEIVVICDDSIWESSVRDSLEYYFSGPYPVIPRPEPLFDLRHFSAQELMNESLRRQLRTYLIVSNTSDDNSPTTQMVKSDLGEERLENAASDTSLTTSVGRNKWATGQILIYLLGNSADNISNKIRIHFQGIAKRINQHDYNQLEATTFAKGINKGLTEKLFDKYGIRMDVPLGYILAQENEQDGFIWLRNELKDGTMSLIFRKLKYTRTEQLDKEYAKRLRDDYGRKYISSPEPGSYMVTNDVDLPMFEYQIEIDGHYAKEFRGIWEMENDFMGGPFITFLILNEETSELMFIDAFVFMPGQSKRNYMMQMDLVVKNLLW